ncbi:hypothetical protein BJ508DRAFT_412050 [Ascobolus immersus RN42]|uniref:Uncharacterized protein n=1 Tax=Ascobolus immersus RN42 TaxID=1160509 RepID=A0A3N4IGJ0_ASCIM|nr:hypothetical protein BJ508DRAFT_412050 [Ascobolus immersus RN42]
MSPAERPFNKSYSQAILGNHEPEEAQKYKPANISLIRSQKVQLSIIEPLSRHSNNLFQASKKYNLVFLVRVHKINVFEPSFPSQTLPAEPLTVLDPLPDNSSLPLRVGINNIHVGELGTEEVLVSVHENGKVFVWYTRDLSKPVFSASVHRSAWGIATHKESRRVAISANSFQITVFELGLRKHELEFRRDQFGESELDVKPDGYVKPSEAKWDFSEEGQLSWEMPEESEDKEELLRRDDAWKVVFQKQVITLKGHQHNIPSISFLPDPSGRWIASAGIDGTFKIWDIDAETEVANHLVNGTWSWTVLGLSPHDFYETNTMEEALGVRDVSQQYHRASSGRPVYDITTCNRSNFFTQFLDAAQGFLGTMHHSYLHHGPGVGVDEDDEDDDDDDEDDDDDDEGSGWEDDDDHAEYYDMHDDYDIEDLNLEYYLNQHGSDDGYGEIWAGGGNYIEDDDEDYDEESIQDPEEEDFHTGDEDPPPLEPMSGSEASDHTQTYESVSESMPDLVPESDAEPPAMSGENMDLFTDSEQEEYHFDAPPDLISESGDGSQAGGGDEDEEEDDEDDEDFQNPAGWPEMEVVFEDEESQEEYWSDPEGADENGGLMASGNMESVLPNPNHFSLPKPEARYPPTNMTIFAADQRHAYIYNTTPIFGPTVTCNPFIDPHLLGNLFSQNDKINMTAFIPELSLLFAGQKSKGKVAVFRLTRHNKLFAFRLDKVLPSQDDHTLALGSSELAGIAVQPLQGMQISEDSALGREKWRGVELTRKWRLWISYMNGQLLCYDIDEDRGRDDLLFV